MSYDLWGSSWLNDTALVKTHTVSGIRECSNSGKGDPQGYCDIFNRFRQPPVKNGLFSRNM